MKTTKHQELKLSTVFAKDRIEYLHYPIGTETLGVQYLDQICSGESIRDNLMGIDRKLYQQVISYVEYGDEILFRYKTNVFRESSTDLVVVTRRDTRFDVD